MMVDNSKVDIASGGFGQFLSRLKKEGTLKAWKNKGIQFLNFCGISDFNKEICDPCSIALLDGGKEILVDCWERKTKKINSPIFLVDSQKTLDIYYPFEVGS